MTAPVNSVIHARPHLDRTDVELVRKHLHVYGYVYLTGIPDEFDHAAELPTLGPLFPQYHGALVRDVTPDPRIPATVVSPGNTGPVTPHTELYEFPGKPPRYVALWGVRPAEGPGGETTLADAYRYLEQLDPATQRALYTRMRRWRSTPTLATEGVEMANEHPIAERHPAGLILRFSTLDLDRSDPLVGRYIDRGREYFDATKIDVKIERNGLLIWDNWRMLHGRNGFTDPNRLLRRVLIAQPD